MSLVRNRDFIDILLSPVRAGFEGRFLAVGMNFWLNPPLQMLGF
ncbi:MULTISPECIES: hypothetical protein [Chroococcidiopsis]|nr:MULTISPECIES: hypothetical protein [Chroococcidiopsis]